MVLLAQGNHSAYTELDQLAAALPAGARGEYPGTKFFLRGKCSTYPDVAHYYDFLRPDPARGNRSVFADMSNRSCLNGFAFGNIGTTATDAARFFFDLLGPTPRVLDRASVAAMTEFGPGSVAPYTNTSYGLGIWRTSYLSLGAGQLDSNLAGLAPFLRLLPLLLYYC